jgi:hypothetical protein
VESAWFVLGGTAEYLNNLFKFEVTSVPGCQSQKHFRVLAGVTGVLRLRFVVGVISPVAG